MYLVKVEVKDSNIDGKGVFTTHDVKEGSVVWKFVKDHDHAITPHEFEALSGDERTRLQRIAYLSPTSGLWVYPPPGDPAEYTNHSSNHNLSVKVDETISTEPFFVANRDIDAGEELTNNYHEFDLITQRVRPDWAA